MTDALEGLSSKALHDLAVHHALRHVNVKFFWDLMKILPAAETGKLYVTHHRGVAAFDLVTDKMLWHTDSLGTGLYDNARGSVTVTRMGSRPVRDRVVFRLVG